MMKIVNIGVIGCGNMAMHLLRRCAALERGRVTAIYDPSPEAQETAWRELDAVSTPDIETLLKRPDVDALLIGSPPSLHKEHVLMAAAAGKPIYCEKPLSVTTADCDEMIEACRKARVSLFVGQVLRLFPLFWKSRLLIEEGKIGTPRALTVTRAGYHTMFHSGWRTEKAKAGGLLLETNVHEFDYMRFILGEPVEVYARLDNLYGDFDYEDQAFAIVTFASGATASLHASLSSPMGKYQVEIQGTGGNMTHSGFKGPLQYQAPGGDVHEVLLEELSTPDPYDWELTSWLDSLTTGTAPLFTGADGRVAVAMAEAAMLSFQENRPVRLSELLD